MMMERVFQSRNRDAFRFKKAEFWGRMHASHCFNLVIEMLFVSRSVRNTL